MKRASSFSGLIAASLSVISLTGCLHEPDPDPNSFDARDLEPLCQLAPNALALAVSAIARGRQSFAEVEEFVRLQGTGVVISGGCKALVTGMIQNPNRPLTFDLKLPQGVVDDLTNTRTGLLECLNWPLDSAERTRCFQGEIGPPQ